MTPNINEISKKLITCIRIDDSWINRHLTSHGVLKNDHKVIFRAYTVSFSGTTQELDGMIHYFASQIDKFLFSDKESEEFKKTGQQPLLHALKSFGGYTDPLKDGKYGELVLFLLVESILKVPMIAHKISTLSNENDQVKGGDGIFLGLYEGVPSILIGESKIYQKRADAMEQALVSLNKFHSENSGGKIFRELLVAQKNISNDFEKDELEYLYKCLSQGSDEYKQCNKVHPVLIIYDDNKINNFETQCKNKDEGESLMKQHMQSELNSIRTLFESKMENYPEIKKHYVDVFFIPLKDVNFFRNRFYFVLHGMNYLDLNKKKKRYHGKNI